MKHKSPKLRVGHWVEVRSREEILRTLDDNGQLDGMPFMPEMFAFCGKKFRVYKSAHKTCDTVFPVRGRRVESTIHLDTRCDGSAHGGCEASCLLFWKEAWLKPLKGSAVEEDVIPSEPTNRRNVQPRATICSESDVWFNTQMVQNNRQDPVYVCQATRLPYATSHLAWWDVRQYIEDYLSGNVGIRRIVNGFVYSLYFKFSQSGIGLGRPMTWFYDRFHHLWRGTPFPRKTGTIPTGQRTPVQTLNLQPGELVQIKSHEEILKTLSTDSTNRGLYWDAEEVPYCGGIYKVLKRVERIIDERTGKMQVLKTPCIILDSVTCESRFSECRLFCPRSIYAYWREIWLERVEPNISDAQLEEGNTVAK